MKYLFLQIRSEFQNWTSHHLFLMSVPTSPTFVRRPLSQGAGADGENTGTGSWLEAISGVMGELLQSWGIIGALKKRGWGTGGRSTSNTPPPYNHSASSNYEHIELSPLNIQNPCFLRIEGARPGQGHDFRATTLERPAWCDACAHLVFYHATTCGNCSLMCHEQCQGVVSLDCKMDSPDTDLQFHDAKPHVEEDIPNADFFPLEDNENPILPNEPNEEMEDCKEDIEEENNVDEGEEEKHEEEMLEKEIIFEQEILSQKKQQEVSTLRRTVRRIQSQAVDSAKIEEWVQKCPANNVGLQITKEEDGGYRGCLRIHLNLSRPINIVTGTRPPSIYDILQEERTLEKTLTSFYMPRDIVKAIHITSKTTTREVIVALLRKFKVVDNPQKFALYERTYDTGQSMKAKLRRLSDNECPLVLAIAWNAQDITNRRLVLQENDTADIQWEAFSLPELDNFLRILDREEGEYKNQIRDKYSLLRHRIQIQLSRIAPMTT